MDTAGVVRRTVHGEFMWPFTARVNEKTAPINGSLPLQFAAAYCEARMSALGHKRTSQCDRLMPALPPKADVEGRASDVRFVPKADSRTAAKRVAIGSPRLRSKARLLEL